MIFDEAGKGAASDGELAAGLVAGGVFRAGKQSSWLVAGGVFRTDTDVYTSRCYRCPRAV